MSGVINAILALIGVIVNEPEIALEITPQLSINQA
jgi:hypothetical protein